MKVTAEIISESVRGQIDKMVKAGRRRPDLALQLWSEELPADVLADLLGK